MECESHRECGDREAGLDWGVETFATLAYAPGEYAEEENDRPLAAEQEALKTESRALSKALRGRRSKRAMKVRKALARRHRRVANRRKDRNHQITARLVRVHKLIATEELAPVEHDGIGQGHGRETRQERQGEGGAEPRDPRRHPGLIPEYAQHQSGRSWVRADRLEYPQREAVPDGPLLRDRSEESLG